MKIIVNEEVYYSNEGHIIPNDNFTEETADYAWGLDGIVLNSEKVNLELTKRSIMDGSIQRIYKGSYVLWFYDKQNKKIYIANDLLSKESVFYYTDESLILVNTSFYDLCADLRKNKRTPQINYKALEFFVDEKYFCDDTTYEEHTSFLTAYSYLVIDCEKKHLDINRIPVPQAKTESQCPEKETLAMIEKLFTEGCQLEWNKNVSYGTDQVASISAGMDSRATLIHLMRYGDTNIKTYTYAQSGSTDANVARRWTKRNKLRNTFIPIEKCEFMYMRDEILKANEGQMYYIGSTGAILMAKLSCKVDKPGIVHTGLAGGEMFGDHFLPDRLGGNEKNEHDITANQQENLNNVRRCLNFQKTTKTYFSAFSPFLYEDFFEYMLCLPYSIMKNRKLYKKWYRKYLGSDFPTARCHNVLIHTIDAIRDRIFKYLHIVNPTLMDPLQLWYDKNNDLQEHVRTTWEKDRAILKDNVTLIDFLEKQLNKKDFVHIFCALTISGTIIRIMGLDEN